MPSPRRIARAALCAIPLLVGLGLLDRDRPVRAERAAPASAEQRAELARVRGQIGGRVPEGSLLSIEYTLDVADRIGPGFAAQAELWRKRAARWLKAAAEGRDPLLDERGKLVMRGYRSPVSEHLQGYAIYVPPNYDPARAYPVLLALHGGSANGNLFLGVVLGNNMNWKEYSNHLWDEFAPRWSPEFIVVAPDGFGQVMWRFMGEQDVLDVIADVKRHYHVDEDRIVLSGLSNGGVGAYNIGMRHAHLFSAVLAIAGAPSWLQYSGKNIPPEQAQAMTPLSGMQLGENAWNTDFRYYHGHLDGGPMKPSFVHELTAHMRSLGDVPFKETWFDTGHDLLYLVHRHGRIYADLEKLTRKRRPSEVRLLTGDYRAAQQHWVRVTRIERYPELARVRAVAAGDRITVETRNTLAFELDLAEAPLSPGATLALQVDGQPVPLAARAQLPPKLQLHREGASFRVGPPPAPPGGLEKKPGSSGPITDAYYDALVHVYGTADAAQTDALKQAATRAAQGWPLWLWRVQQKVVADSEVTDALLQANHVVLYGTPGSNRVLERIAAKLPIRVEPGVVVLGDRRIEGRSVGTRFIYPNPLAPSRYVLVQAGTTAAAVRAGNNLPDFLPDYVVYDEKTTNSRPRLVFDRAHRPAAMGFFDRLWQLPPSTAAGAGATGGKSSAAAPLPPPSSAPAAALPPDASPTTVAVAPLPPAKRGVAPPPPPPPSAFAAPAGTQAGEAARQIAQRVQRFHNYRAKIPLATWLVDPAASWSIRDSERCLDELRALRIKFRPHPVPLATPVATPVELEGDVDGVQFQMVHKNRPLLMSCELATRLPEIAKAVKPHGVRALGVISSYRDRPYSSFHTLGLALDIWRFFTDTDMFSVKRDFELTPGVETCSAPPPRGERGRVLLDIACRLLHSRKFSSVLTPNYNAGHRDHFHLDIRPDDPRLFAR